MADVELDVTFESSTVNLDTDFGIVYVIDGNTAVKVIANKYSNDRTYVVDEYVIQESLLYRCITPVDEPEEFDSEKWLNIKLADDVKSIKSALDTKANSSDLYTKTEVDNIVYNILPDDTASGTSVEFNTSLALPLKSVEIDVSATQASGTPTPANPLSISGVSEIEVTHNEDITVIQLGDTYFGGTFIQNGKLRQFRATHKIFDFGDGYIGGYHNISGAQVFMATGARSDIKIGTFAGMCSCYKAVNKDSWHLNNYEMSLNNKDPMGTYVDGLIYFRNDDYTQAQAEELKQSMAGQKIVYELATPIIIDLPDGDTISTVSGANTFSAGEKTMRVAFKCSIEEYINAQSS